MKTHVPIMITGLIVLLLSSCKESPKEDGKETEMAAPTTDINTAVLYGDLETVKQHIKAGSDLNKKEPMSGSTPLISAATFDKREIAQALIAAGADLTAKGNDGSTALHVASFFCRVEIVKMLLDANADKMAKNDYGATARESVSGPFAEIKPIYEMMQQQLSPLGLQLDLNEIKKTRPVISIMLQ